MPHADWVEVASVGDLDGDEPRVARFQGEAVLLVRDGEAVRAVGATCPHAGGPLAEGVRHGTRIVCPWHKAAFCIRTGRVLDPPALDPLPRFDVRIGDGRIALSKPGASGAPQPCDGEDGRVFVIVGAGAAGAMAAQTLRVEGFRGRVVMLDRANRVPYDRTILSKYALSGKPGAEKSPLQSQQFYRDHDIERHTADVTHVEPASRRIACADGTAIRYDAALLATGGAPARPDLPGASLRNVFLLRSRADAEAILAHAERSTRAAILGESFIGMEVAASLWERGLDVTVIGKAPVPFLKQLGPEIGGAFVGLHERRGVRFRLGANVTHLEGSERVSGVRLGEGTTIDADLVVVGFGVRPAIGYASDLPAQDGAIAVDAHLRAVDGLYAAGDIARFPLRGDGPPIRVEHWRVAQQQGRVAALNMLGRPTRYDAVPYFWTIQYLKRLDYVGHASDWDNVVIHGDLGVASDGGAPNFLAYYVKDGIVVAAAGMDRDRDTAALIELFTTRRDWRAEALGGSPHRLL